MKGIILLLAIYTAIFISCSNEQSEKDDSSDGIYTVNFNLQGEILEVTNSPLTKANEPVWYAIQVYDKLLGRTEYTPYAYGLFNNMENISITLKNAYTYKIVCNVCFGNAGRGHGVDGLHSLYDFESASSSKLELELTPDFQYTSEYALSNLSNHWQILPATIYYGKVEEYSGWDNVPIVINTKIMNYGLKYILTDRNMNPVVDETNPIKIKIDNNYSLTLTGEEECVYSVKNFEKYYDSQDYIESIPIKIEWDDVNYQIRSHQIIRNERTTFKIGKQTHNDGFSINIPENMNWGTDTEVIIL